MADQATMTGQDDTRQETRGGAGGVGAFGSDLARLASLQARLFALDLAESIHKAGPALITLVIASLALPAVFSVATLGLVLWVSSLTGISTLSSCFLVAASLLLLLLMTSSICLLIIRRSLGTFHRSADELRNNLAWMIAVLSKKDR